MADAVAQRNGPTTQESALAQLAQAEADLRTVRALVEGRPTKKKKHQAFQLLAGIQSACEVLKIQLDPW